jgi:TRAP-type C4-dicarboxylate transport system substrate-binding protein
VKKKVFLISLAVVLALSLSIVGCAGEQEEEEETFDLILSDHNPPTNPMAQAIVAYGQYIEDHSDGNIEVETHTGGSLFLDTELLEAVQTGGADAGHYVPEIGDGFYYVNVVCLPLVGLPADELDAIDIVWTLMDEFPDIQGEFNDEGVHMPVLRIMPPVHLHFHYNTTIVDEPSDMSGLSLICLEGLTVAMVEAFGGTGVQRGFFDLFTDLIPPYLADGFVNHYALLGMMGPDSWIHELKGHTEFGDSGLYRQPIGIVWNKDTWDALIAAGYGAVLEDAYDEWLSVALPGTEPDIANSMAAIAAGNHTVTVLTEGQIDAFEALCAPIYSSWISWAADPAVAEAVFNRTLELTGGA